MNEEFSSISNAFRRHPVRISAIIAAILTDSDWVLSLFFLVQPGTCWNNTSADLGHFLTNDFQFFISQSSYHSTMLVHQDLFQGGKDQPVPRFFSRCVARKYVYKFTSKLLENIFSDCPRFVDLIRRWEQTVFKILWYWYLYICFFFKFDFLQKFCWCSDAWLSLSLPASMRSTLYDLRYRHHSKINH
jgi:hypothetical protein